MNEQQPNEKHLADKLKQLPLPDADKSWEQMRLLLDKEMPRGGNSYSRWWMIVMATMIVLLGIWFAGTQFSATKKSPTAIVTKVPAKETTNSSGVSFPNASSTEKGEGDKETTNKSQVVEKNDKSAVIDPRTENDLLTESSGDKATAPADNSNRNNLAADVKSKSGNTLTKKNSSNDSKKQQISGAGRAENNVHNGDRTNLSAKNKNEGADEKKKNETSKDSKLKIDEYVNSSNETENNQSDNTNELVSGGNQKSSGLKANSTKTTTPGAMERLVRSSNIGTIAHNTATFSPATRFGDSIDTNYRAYPMPEKSGESLTKQSKRNNKRKLNSFPGNKPSTSGSNAANTERSFAVGLSMPLGFPLGDQNALGYNINAKGNTLSDYLPAPHLQYHFNEKLYLQSEFQFQSPQYIQPILLYQHKTEISATNRVHYQSIYAKKLYYFNFPVGIHYSPFKNFYMGTGLQFSSLLSGVALHDERITRGMGPFMGDSIISQRYLKFKDDSISHKLTRSELRLGLDANYYWHKFTVGLRYNQALSNYVSIRLFNNSPLVQDKNKSLQFYLRYNLWEDRKRKSGNRTLSTK